MYSQSHGISCICLRIGWVVAEDRPRNAWAMSQWCSQRDIAQLVERCFAAPESVRFDVFFGVSVNPYPLVDIEHARQVLGYEPQDRAQDYPASGDPMEAFDEATHCSRGKSSSAVLKVVPLLPDNGPVPLRWRLIVPVNNNGPAIDRAVPHIESEGARVVSIQPQGAPLPSSERTHFFILLEQVGSSVPSSVTVRLGDVSVCAESPWVSTSVRCHGSAGPQMTRTHLSRGLAGSSLRCQPLAATRVPGSWDCQARVCWLRTRCRVPRSWQGRNLQLEMRALGTALIAMQPF